MQKYYVGLDVHKATIAIAILDAFGKVISQSIIETSTQAVRDFFQGLRGEIHITFEEGNHAAWLHDVVQPRVFAGGRLQSQTQPQADGWQ